MPIRINLLAEAQAAEEQRRKDPVKRGIYAGAALVIVVVLWAASLQVKVMGAKSELSNLDAKWKAIETSYQAAVDIQLSSRAADAKLASLHRMTTNRFLWGNVLNGFQQSMNNLSDVQVVRLKAEQMYAVTEGTPAKTNRNVVTPAKPGAATEKISMTIEAMDTGAQPGNRVNPFKESIANVAYFKEHLAKTNGVLLTSRSAPQQTPAGNGVPLTFVMFSLKCSFPEKTR